MNAARLDSMGSLRSAGSEKTDSSANESSDSIRAAPAQRSPWPSAPVTAMYTLTANEPPPAAPQRVQFATALPVMMPIVAQMEKQESYPSQPARAHAPPNQLLIRLQLIISSLVLMVFAVVWERFCGGACSLVLVTRP